LWLALVLIGQFLLATVALVDKYIVTSKTVVLRPFTYTFWISLLSSGSVIIYFFSWVPIPIEGLSIPSFANIEAPSLMVFALAVTAGYAFFTALLSMFTALKTSDASDVVPVVGAVNAVATFMLGYYFLGTTLTDNFLIGFVLLVAGTLITSHFRLTFNTFLTVLHSGLMFGVHYVCIKALFLHTNFDTAFFWSRLAIVGIALSMLLIPYYYKKVMIRTRKAKRRDGAFLLGNKVLGGLASILLLKAIEIGDVALVQALGGLQYLFLLGFSACCGRYLAKRGGKRKFKNFFERIKAGPRHWHQRVSKDLGEGMTVMDIVQKAVAIPLIVLGLFFLFF